MPPKQRQELAMLRYSKNAERLDQAARTRAEKRDFIAQMLAVGEQ